MPAKRTSAQEQAPARLPGWTASWLLAALVLRAGLSMLLGDRFYQADEHGYDGAALALARWGLFGGAGAGEDLIFSPGAPAFFSLVHLLGGGVRAVRLGQALLSTLTAWMIGRAAEDLTGSGRVGRWALAVACVYPFFVYYAGLLLSETVYLAASVGGLWLLSRSVGEAGADVRRAAAAGLLLSAAGLTRTEGVAVAMAVLAALAVLSALRRYSPRSLAVAVLVWAVPLAGWVVRNKSFCGAYVLDVHGGVTMLHGTMLFEVDQIDTAASMEELKATPLWRESRHLGVVERDRLFFREALRFMRENPGRTLGQWARKFVNFWRLCPRRDKVYPSTAKTRPGLGLNQGLLAAVSLLFEPLLIAGGLWGAWRTRARWERLLPVYVMILVTCAVHVAVVSQMRYRLPVMPWLILLACAAADLQVAAFEGKRG